LGYLKRSNLAQYSLSEKNLMRTVVREHVRDVLTLHKSGKISEERAITYIDKAIDDSVEKIIRLKHLKNDVKEK